MALETEMRARLTRHLGESSPQFQAAERALERKLALNPKLSTDVIDEWLAGVWPARRSGIVDPISAQRMLEAFSDLGPRPPPPALLGQLKLTGAQARLAAKDDGRSWTELIDQRTVPAEVEAFLVDLDWLARLDLTKRSDFESFGAWAGWNPANHERTYGVGVDFSTDWVNGWLRGLISSRHRVPHAFTDQLAEAFTAPDRPRAVEKFGTEVLAEVRRAIERDNVFDAFLLGAVKTHERIRGGLLDEDAARADLARQLGLSIEIEPRDFHDMLQPFSPSWRTRGDPEDPAEYAAYAKGLPSVQVFYKQYVLNGEH